MPGQRASGTTRREQILKAAYEVALQRGIDGVTVRAVAAKAKISPGLVLFHFTRKAKLILALLDWVLATASILRIPDSVAPTSPSLERLRAVLEQEIARLTAEPRRLRLLWEFWALGIRHAAIRLRIRAELDGYRRAFRAMTADVLRMQPAYFTGVTPDGLAAVAVSFINGCAMQAMIDPEHFDLGEYLAAVHGLIGQVAAAAA
jgi:AcrR family transcriptional regulator